MKDGLAGDLRFALRTLRKDKMFSAVAVATLALAIGANTAVFSLVDAIVLRPLAYRDAGRLVAVHEIVPKFAYLAPLIPVNAGDFAEWRKSVHAFEQAALLNENSANLTGSGEPERVKLGRVSPSLFPMLGVEPRLGRTFMEQEDQQGRDGEVVLDDAFWRRRFGADSSVIGRKITLDGRPFEVIGVLPADFRFPKLSQLYAMTIDEERPEIWKPLAANKYELEHGGDYDFACIARLRRGVTRARAEAELNAVQAVIARQAPFKFELRAALVPLQEQIVNRSKMGLELILAAVAAVLLIACVNIANLLLARASGRRREMAIRCAMGAGRWRLVRQALAESFLVAMAGGIAGMAVAFLAMRAILAYAPADVPRMDEVHPDARLLLFNFLVAAAAGLFFGLLPAWRVSQADPQEAMRSGGRGATAGPGAGRLRGVLVALEAGLSAMCLIGGGLLLHSFVNLLRVDGGFQADRVITADVRMPRERFPNDQKRSAFLKGVLDRLAALPGVIAAGTVSNLPLSGEGNNNLAMPEGRNWPVMDRPLCDMREVDPNYFRTMGVPLRTGRVFSETDGARSVAVISERTAARLWPGEDPIGKRFFTGQDTAHPIEVVGIVGDIHGVSLGKPPSATIYRPYWQSGQSGYSLVVRAAMNAAAVAPAIRAAIRQVDADMPIPPLRTMGEIVDASVAQRRFQLALVLLFGVAALLLAGLGIYGVVAYSVAQRTNEMGIRMALGAAPGRIRRMVLGQGMAPVALGLAGGVAGALALGRLLRNLLFGVSSADPATIAAVSGALLLVAAAASYLPARRATRVDPAAALRYE